MVEGLSVILKKQNPHPSVPGEEDPEQDASALGSDQLFESDPTGMIDGEWLDTSDEFPIYAQTPVGSAFGLRDFDAMLGADIAAGTGTICT
eukprot:1975649-Rhodomonas_salina.2